MSELEELKENLLENSAVRLETAVQIIGDLISFKMTDLNKARAAQNTDLIEKLNAEVAQLSIERHDCYNEVKGSNAINKAFEVYGPQLKKLV